MLQITDTKRILDFLAMNSFKTISFIIALAVGCLVINSSVTAQTIEPLHGLALHGQPKYGKDFMHFDYVNPSAPKGGSFRNAARGTFDSFHTHIDIGNAIDTGSNETLMVSSADEAFSMYGLIAESVELAEDRSWIIFNLRQEARWHDGVSITADDVVWTFETLITKGEVLWRSYYANVEKAEKLDTHRVKFSLTGGNNRELPLIVGQMPVLPKHYWETRDFTKTTLEPPLGSGPYRVKEFEPGRYVIYERVEDYWGADLPVNVGQNNFDQMRTDFYRDDTAIRLALKAGDIDVRVENQAKAWVSDYEVDAVKDGWLKKEAIRHHLSTGMQAFAMNIRRVPFDDRKVRQALAYAFDFEWSNKTLFNDQYARTESYFSNSELAATGLPAGEELEILEKYRDQIPPEVFTQAYAAPKTDGSGLPRQNLKIALELLSEAGWIVEDLKLINAETGQQMSFEILLVSQAFERIVLPFTRNLKRLGIETQIRLVDPSQYTFRIQNRDFDMIVFSWGQSLSPGNEQRDYWGSNAADVPSTRNLVGIKDPVVDEIIELIIQAPDRESLTQRTRALDRVLLFGHYVIPQWHTQNIRLLYWDKYSRPSTPVKSGVLFGRWWFDAYKSESLAESYESN